VWYAGGWWQGSTDRLDKNSVSGIFFDSDIAAERVKKPRLEKKKNVLAEAKTGVREKL
tara:strand:+ start:127 stop:300 length:174 start_codon:yes stop_codon:yes gene_type:complete